MGDQVKGTEMGRKCSKYGERRDAWTVLVGKTEGERLLERPRHRWENSIKVDHIKVKWGCMD